MGTNYNWGANRVLVGWTGGGESLAPIRGIADGSGANTTNVIWSSGVGGRGCRWPSSPARPWPNAPRMEQLLLPTAALGTQTYNTPQITTTLLGRVGAELDSSEQCP